MKVSIPIKRGRQLFQLTERHHVICEIRIAQRYVIKRRRREFRFESHYFLSGDISRFGFETGK